MFRSLKHEVRMLEVDKLSLSRDDDKHITVNGISSLARGHHRTVKYNLLEIVKCGFMRKHFSPLCDTPMQ